MRHGPLLLLGAALAVAGCIRDPDPFTIDDDRVSIHFILEAGADTVVARITRPGDGYGGVPEASAIVRLIAGADTIPLSYESDPNLSCVEPWGAPAEEIGGCFHADLPEAIRPGDSYELEVILADESRITGRTTVPLPVTVTSPADGERIIAECNHPDYCYGLPLDEWPYTVPVADVTFRWAPAQEPGRVGVGLRPLRAFLAGTAYPANVCGLGYFFRSLEFSGDSASWSIPNIGCGEPLQVARFDSIHAEAVVYTRNGEFARYLDALRDGPTLREEFAAIGIEGHAWGVFGAVASTRRTITIVRNPVPGASPAGMAP